MAEITFIKDGKKILVTTDEEGQTLLELAQENDVDMDTACGGNGVCTTCMVKVNEGEENLGTMTDQEEMMGMDPDDMSVRLGCQCIVSGNAEVELAF